MREFEKLDTQDDTWTAKVDKDGWLLISCHAKSDDRPDDGVSFPPDVVAWLAKVAKKATE